jgi:hypothetical protein
MTLNSTVVTHTKFYQSGDFLLTDVRTKLPRPYPAQKSILVQRSGWTALVAFSGIGSVGNLEVADWLAAETDKLPEVAPFEVPSGPGKRCHMVAASAA